MNDKAKHVPNAFGVTVYFSSVDDAKAAFALWSAQRDNERQVLVGIKAARLLTCIQRATEIRIESEAERAERARQALSQDYPPTFEWSYRSEP